MLAGTVVFAQREIDENGRPLGAKPSFTVSSVEDVYLAKSESSVAGSEIKLNYSLPSGVTSGKITLFHPRRDEELKSYNLNSETGTVSISLKNLPISTFSAGLYDSEGKFLKSFNVY
ncbi:hypothetical protein AFM12_11400 [Jiulongibacter sediminis]|uniref:Macroglobulin domain-containing protein n=2 Tax=Jiulongibacter sediminis TaxID=1605367 RepID=A0A0P7BBH5_9BACT|nr:hypothetical protein AFM12_11400 [Jiulongibacter sediminis]TBX24029.1 hypothetical protein TK44_11405 [Jiulongibacter sediminis]